MKKGFTLIQLLGIIIILLIIFWLITGDTKNIDCYMTTKGLICSYGKLGE